MSKYLYVQKNWLNQFEAYDEETEELLNKIKCGEVLKFKLEKVRCPEHNKKWRKLVNIIFDNQDYFRGKEHMINEIKIRAGWYEEYITMKGDIRYVPKSLAFDECDQIEFDEFYKKAVLICLNDFIDSNNNELIDKIVRF